MNHKGFTLIEVSLGLFIAVIASAYAAKTMTSTNHVVAIGRETFVATNLAHDGIDLVRAMRDTTWFTDTNRSVWMSKSGICETTDDHSFTIDPWIVRNFRNNPTGSDSKVKDTSQPVLYAQPKNANLNSVWTHQNTVLGAEETRYSRILEAECAHVNDPVDPQFVEITSTVLWVGQGGEVKTISLKEHLYNWLP